MGHHRTVLVDDSRFARLLDVCSFDGVSYAIIRFARADHGCVSGLPKRRKLNGKIGTVVYLSTKRLSRTTTNTPKRSTEQKPWTCLSTWSIGSCILHARGTQTNMQRQYDVCFATFLVLLHARHSGTFAEEEHGARSGGLPQVISRSPMIQSDSHTPSLMQPHSDISLHSLSCLLSLVLLSLVLLSLVQLHARFLGQKAITH